MAKQVNTNRMDNKNSSAITKKEKSKKYSNYRKISLTSTVYKIYVNWLSTKLINMLEELPLYQTGYRKNRSVMTTYSP
jgi:hypothetical protein